MSLIKQYMISDYLTILKSKSKRNSFFFYWLRLIHLQYLNKKSKFETNETIFSHLQSIIRDDILKQ